jgi:hypothetical protein
VAKLLVAEDKAFDAEAEALAMAEDAAAEMDAAAELASAAALLAPPAIDDTAALASAAIDDAAALASAARDEAEAMASEAALDAAAPALVAALDAEAAALPSASVAELPAAAMVLPTPDAMLPAAPVPGIPVTTITGLPERVVVYVVGDASGTGITSGTDAPAAFVVTIVCKPASVLTVEGIGAMMTGGVTTAPYGWFRASGAFVARGTDGVDASGSIGTMANDDGGGDAGAVSSSGGVEGAADPYITPGLLDATARVTVASIADCPV